MIIREATPEDAGGISRVRVDTWRSTYAGLLPEEYLRSLSYREKEAHFRQLIADKKEHFFVAETVPGNIIGFAACGMEREEDPVYRGEIYAIYVLDAYQRRGVGRMLMETAMKKLRSAGFGSMLIWVLDGNSSCRFYERMGGARISSKKTDISSCEVDLIAYGWTDIGTQS